MRRDATEADADAGSPHDEWAPPLLSRRPYRTLVALALVLVTGGALLLGLFLLVFEPDAWQAGVALLMLFCLPFAVRPVELGRWSANWLRWPEMVAFVLLLAVAIGLGVRGLAHGIALLDERDWTGATPLEIAFWLGEGTAALGGAFLLLASVPLPLPRRAARWALAALAVVVSACGLATAVVYAGPDGCGSFAVDRERWLAGAVDSPSGDDRDRERIADAIVRCDALDGMTIAEVRAALGPEAEGDPDIGAHTRGWPVGWVNDGIGPGDEQYLEVQFADGRVAEASLRYDEYADD
ncbi:hypothetical protein VSS74_22455 [Conexibacter stalactiti]|uniref:Uncharacterized protein n=1 Tax=Conexibacter stalactiti TaxID=1940611 RepID=A0ABU4HXB2_9ACTN|nr:hypothetical protein [Conexibacter stalactiti]MDW5597125.1 hypothetical protein [Conexibacter stalactiti]MEC5037767.1 hypothetical protein [Conexibacter stalactiti]